MENETKNKIGFGMFSLFIALLLIGFFLGYTCGSKHDNQNIIAKPEVENNLAKQNNPVKSEKALGYQEESNNIMKYTFAQKDDFTKKMKNNLILVNNKLDNLGNKFKKLNGQDQIDANQKIQGLRLMADQLKKQIEKINSANESNWDNTKADVNKAFNELQDNINQANSWLGDKLGS